MLNDWTLSGILDSSGSPVAVNFTKPGGVSKESAASEVSGPSFTQLTPFGGSD